MSEPKIKLNRKNDMDLLMKTYPIIRIDELLQGGCYFLKMKDGSIICYDCRGELPYKSWNLKGRGFTFNKELTHSRSVATRHISFAPNAISHIKIKTLYSINEDEYEALQSKVNTSQKSLHDSLSQMQDIIGKESLNRFFCSPDLNVVVNVRPHGYVLNPNWCKAPVAYYAEEELSLISPPFHLGGKWWYYPGRMYLKRVKWIEISKKDYNAAKQHILDKEREIYNMINTIIDEIFF